jgi:phenylacetate-CoA ligase
MNPLTNPFISLPLLKAYLTDAKRIQKKNSQQIEQYKIRSLRKIVSYAYTIPFYHDIYKKAGIHPHDIRTLNDITKLPFVTKDDIKNQFPNNLLPKHVNTQHKHVVCTGGTTGKPLCIHTDFYTIGKAVMLTIRELDSLGFDWKHTTFAHIGNFNPYRIDLVSQQHFQEHLKPFFRMDNTRNIDVNTPLKTLINTLEDFNPEVIMTYPAIFQHLAYLKRKGYGKKLTPKLFWTGGAMLDDYTRHYVEDAFQCRLLNIYPSVEAQADIAFECLKGTWHIHDDYFHLEAIDENGELVSPGERGHMVLTRLWGTATPMIRYTGMDDWIRLKTGTQCDCGLTTTIIQGGVEGRMRANIALPNGKIFPAGAFCFIDPVLNKHNTFKIKQYQIIQQKINEIDILLVIDEDLRHKGISVETLKEEIKQIYQQKVGPDITITVKEVDEITHPKDASKPPPIVISHVSEEERYQILDR